MKRLLVAMAMLCVSLAAVGQNAAVNGFCTAGGKPAKTQGAFATNFQQEIIPSCTVTVYLTGTLTLATLVTSTGSAAPNPFTANAVGSAAPGQWLFYTLTGTGVDIVLSGGVAPNTFPTPVTITDVVAGGSGGGGAFNPLVKDAISGPTGGTTEVVGLLNNLLPTLTPGFLNWTGSAWAFSPGGGGGAAPNPPIFSLQAYATGSSLTSDPNITINTSTHTLTSTNFTTPTRSYQNRSDMIDAVADCGAVGDGTGAGTSAATGTDNQTAIANCLTANPYVTIFFPPRNGSAQAQYYHSGTWTLGAHQAFESTGGAYAHGLGAIISSPAGDTSIIITGAAGRIRHINVLGSEPASENSSDVANLIFPSGTIATEYQTAVNYISTNGSGVTTLYFNFAQSYMLNGQIIVAGLPSPFTALNGTYYVLSECPNIHASCQISNTGWLTIYTGAATQTRISVASGTVMPATTGTSGATGIVVQSSFVQLEDLYVSAFGRNCIEQNGTVVADDLLMTNVQTLGCRSQGFWPHGGDTNGNVITGFTSYFNQNFGLYDQTFLHTTWTGPQLSYNRAGAVGWAASSPGPAFTISTISRVCSGATCTLTVNTSATNPYVAGQGVLITGVSDTSFNAPLVSGLNPTVSCFIATVPSSTQFTCVQPIYQSAITTGSSSGGQVQLGSQSQIFFGSSMWGGAYWMDGGNDSANISSLNNYDEGGQGQGDNGCANFYGAGSILLGAHNGDCIDPNFYPGIFLTAGSAGAFISPATIAFFGKPYNTQLNLHESINTGDTNDLFVATDLLGGAAGSLINTGFEGFRFTNPGQNNSVIGMRTFASADEAGKYNYAYSFGYGGSARAGESAATGSVTFVGSGLNDLTAGGTITTTSPQSYLVTVCATGTPDQFAWQTGGSGPVSTVAGGVTIASGGTGYTVGDSGQIRSNDGGNDFVNFTISGVSSGVVTNFVITFPGLKFVPGLAVATSGAGEVQLGPIATSSVSVGGTGYNNGDTFSVFPGVAGTSPALGTVTGVSGGVVTSYTLTYPGSGGSYAVRTKGTTTLTGGGSGLVINITAVSGTGLTYNVLILQAMSSCANMASGANTLSNGVTATWAATTGHTLANYWTIPIVVTYGNRPQFEVYNDIWWGNSAFNRQNWYTKSNNAAPAGTRPDGSAFAEGDVSWNYNPPSSTGTAFWIRDAGGTWQAVSYGSGASGVTWPATGDIVVSNSTNSPAGLAESDGLCAVGSGGVWTTGACSGSAATAFSAITGSTNTTAAMVVGTGASIAATGSGAITATAVPAAGITGTTLPSGIVTSSLTALGTIATGVWQGTLIGSTHGGTGVNNASTLTLGSSNQNWATLGTGVVKNTTSTGALSNAIAADIIALWSGTCNSSSFLRGDGACAATPTGTVTSIVFSAPLTGGTITTTGTVGCPTCVTSAASLTSGLFMLGAGTQGAATTAHLDDGVTTGSTITSSEPIVAPSGTFTGGGIPIASGTSSNTDLAGQLTLVGGTKVYTFTATYASAPICVATDTTAANAVQTVVTTTTLTLNGTSTDVLNYICIGRN